VRELRLTLEGEGVLHRLVRRTWMAERPCTLRDDPEEFARVLGPQWKRAMAVTRQQFTPLADEPHILRCEWLYEEWLSALKKHESYQTRGAKGGRPRKQDGEQIEAQLKPGRKAQPTPQLSAPPAQPKAGLSQSSSEGNSSPPSEERAIPPADGGAPAPVGAALASATNGIGDYLDRASTREALARAGVRPFDAAESSRPPTPLAAQNEAIAERQREYAALLHNATDDWLDLYPDARADIEREAAREMGARDVDHVPLLRLSAFRGLVVEAVRQRAKWPTERQWDGVTPFGPSAPVMT
jgi:uncharacterized protein YdaU (DUF1376 family)